MYTLSAKIYPNNEIRLRQALAVPSKSKGRREPDFVLPSNLDIRSEFPQSLSEALKPEVTTDRAGYGGPPRKTKFTTLAKRTIMRVGGVIDQLNQDSTELTATLPGSTDESFDAIARYSGYVAARVNNWIYNQCAQDPGYGWFYVWERQKRGALHLHWCLTTRDNRLQKNVRRHFQRFWVELIRHVSRLSGVDLAARKGGGTWLETPSVWQVHAARIKKSCAAYFSKYCGKSSGKDDSEGRGAYYPSRWWGCSRVLRQRLTAMVQSGSRFCSRGQGDDYRAEILSSLSVAITKVYKYSDRYGEGETHVIYVRPEWRERAAKWLGRKLSVNVRRVQNIMNSKSRETVETPCLNRIWEKNDRRVRFVDSLSQWQRDMVSAYFHFEEMDRDSIEYIEQMSREWWDVETRVSTNAEMRQRAESEASLAEQLELSYLPPPGHRPGGTASAERDYLPPALRG